MTFGEETEEETQRIHIFVNAQIIHCSSKSIGSIVKRCPEREQSPLSLCEFQSFANLGECMYETVADVPES